jgi:hypothetical protein
VQKFRQGGCVYALHTCTAAAAIVVTSRAGSVRAEARSLPCVSSSSGQSSDEIFRAAHIGVA